MILTGHELEIIPSVVAVVAIVGGYLGVRSANQNALKIAREERSSKRQDELKDLQRVTYVKCQAVLMERYRTGLLAASFAKSPGSPEHVNAIKLNLETTVQVSNAGAELALLAPLAIKNLYNEATQCALMPELGNPAPFIRSLSKLRVIMGQDLQDEPLSTPEELDSMVGKSPAMQVIDTSKPVAEISDPGQHQTAETAPTEAR